MVASVIDDLRFAVRSYFKTPGFTVVAVLTLALGTGVNATVFTFVNALLFRPAPVPDPRTLVSVYTSDFSSGPYGDTSYPDYLTLKSDTSAFEGLAAHDGGASALLQTTDSVERIRRNAVSAEFFHLLRITPEAGRPIGPQDFESGSTPVAVISEELRGRVLTSAPDVLQQRVSIDGRSHAIIGVLPRGFTLDLGQPIDAWVPLPQDIAEAGRGDRNLSIVGRLKPGRTLAEAQTEVTTIAARLAREYPVSNLGTLDQRDQPRPMLVLQHTRLPAAFRKEVALLGGVMMAAVGLVLLIACANIANLLLSRAAGRIREMAVRRALGAAGGRILAQMLTESVLLGICGGGLGILFAMWTADALPSFFPAEQAAMLDARIDMRALVFTLTVALASSLLFGMAPAFQTLRTPLADALKGAKGMTASKAGVRMRTALVVAQIALATVLLVSAGLLVRSLLNALQADLGFATREAVVVSLEQPVDRAEAQGLAYYRAVVERVQSLPGIASVSLARTIPLFGAGRRGFRPDGYEFRAGENRELHYNVVSSGFFETMQIPLLAGRPFDSRDGADRQRTAIVNDTLSTKYFGGDAVGRRMTDSSGTVLTIVGVARTHKHLSVQEQPVPVVYYPQEQAYVRQLTLIARTSGQAGAMVEDVRRVAADVDRSVAAYRARSLESRIGEALATDRLAAAMIGVCGVLALMLATVGVYGVVAFAVARRAREFGVRVALGARPSQILALVLREGARVTGVGVVLGIGAAFAAARGLATLLYGVSASDAMTYTAVALALTAVTVVATLLPARRAVRVDPMVVLRDE
jgi:putative ABC transport system permease protein